MGYACFVELHFSRAGSTERRLVQVHAWHGAGSAQTDGARLNRLTRLVNDFQADIYLMGHLHTIMTLPAQRIMCRNGRVKQVNLAVAMTGSWVKGYGQPKGNEHYNPSYVEEKGYKPNRLGCPIVHIRPFLDEFSVEG